jgi:hypothetical protein
MKAGLTFLCCAVVASCLSAYASAKGSANADAFNFNVIATVELTKSFQTKSKWNFVVTQEPASSTRIEEESELGLVHFCFVHNDKPDCSEIAGRPLASGNGIVEFNTLARAEVVRPSGSKPLLMAVGMFYSGGPGSANPTTILWTYRSESDRFKRIFSHSSAANNNEETRLIVSGPLAGDIIVSTAPWSAPYHYGITLYRPSTNGHYVERLRFAGKTRYMDGNPLAVIDSEMLAILTRLHLWKPGDPLPRPPAMPSRCGALELHKDGTEWCAGTAATKQ